MTKSLFTGVVSIVPTKRRRFFWVAWWSAAPQADPFCKPDASSGGARTREEARAQAEAAAGQTLAEIDARWAGAWVRVLRGDSPWSKPRDPHSEGSSEGATSAAARVTTGSRAWAFGVLGLQPAATRDDIKRAFRSLALRAHPDHGGAEAAFIEAKRAYDLALSAVESPRRRRRRA